MLQFVLKKKKKTLRNEENDNKKKRKKKNGKYNIFKVKELSIENRFKKKLRYENIS